MSEYWDVTDEAGRPTGETYRRGAPDWPAGRFHVAVATCVRRQDDAVLLTQRAASKDFPLAWEFPGGNALAGETSEAAAVRELREETGLTVAQDDLTSMGRFAEATALFDLYVVQVSGIDALVLDASEVAAGEWVSLGEVERRLRVGMMADPWNARLGALWAPLAEAVGLER